jgi:2',3'-cyclic-nucleotide 2'-phosphodiesterase (5'-nucleotidase family)
VLDCTRKVGQLEYKSSPAGSRLRTWVSPIPSFTDMRLLSLATVVSLLAAANACEGDHSCYGPLKDDVVLTRNVRRMQPDAQNTTTRPKGPLEWGQINFLHTTDTHGWLEGHIKEQNYGADWGDYVSFTKHMKQKAKKLGVDLLLVDTGVNHVVSTYMDVMLIAAGLA